MAISRNLDLILKHIVINPTLGEQLARHCSTLSGTSFQSTTTT
jgi:hypothetical protein